MSPKGDDGVGGMRVAVRAGVCVGGIGIGVDVFKRRSLLGGAMLNGHMRQSGFHFRYEIVCAGSDERSRAA
jgi:hypothetical protein